ncbi:MAG: hypothetical protein K0V04_20250 [Deltaproteobacteria bacterium]|nr:hypothetical protein [Deltaproteobacteria bacterium]
MRRHVPIGLFVPLCLGALLGGCRDDAAPDIDAPRAVATYHGQIRALVQEHCVGCHQQGGIAPIPLETWEQVEPLASWIVEVVDAGTMPPWGQDPDCRPTEGSLVLSEQDKASFRQWAEQGFAPGDPQDYVAPPPPEPPPEVGAADLVLAAPMPYQVDAELPDDYRCLVVDHRFDADVFVTRLDVAPDRLDLVHHVIVFVAGEEDAAALAALDEADPGPGFSCFGDAGLDNAQQVGGWVPGTEAGGMPEGYATRISAGSTIIVQMHYSTVGVTAADLQAPDQTELALWMLPPGQTPEFLVHTLTVANPDLDIAAGDPAASHEVATRIPVDGMLMATAPHMHLLGKSVETQLVRSSGQQQCLTKVDDWDFNWQRAYGFTQMEPISIDDQIRLKCIHDNSPDNQPLVGGVPSEPRDVGWGDGTYDEMCIDFLTVAVPYQDDGSTGTCAGFRPCNEHCATDDPYCTMSCMTAAGGEACLYCGVDAMLGPCGQSQCLAEAYELGECIEQCSESDFFGCLYDRCDDPMRAYHACFGPRFGDDQCREDLDACPGLLSPA